MRRGPDMCGAMLDRLDDVSLEDWITVCVLDPNHKGSHDYQRLQVLEIIEDTNRLGREGL